MGRGGYSKGQTKGGYGKGQKKGARREPGRFEVRNTTNALLELHPDRLALKVDAAPSKGTFDVEMLEASVQGIGSYAWNAAGPVPCMCVPAMPKMYRPCDRPLGQLPADDEDIIAYEDHLRLPLDPTAPIFQSVRVCQPEFNWAGVDIVLDSNTIRKLIGYMRGTCKPTSIIVRKGVRDSSWKVCVDALGPDGGIILTRVEQRDCVPVGLLGQVFGNHFVKEVTQSFGEPGEMYRRITQVQLGKLSLVVRAEVDACEYNLDEATHGHDSRTLLQHAEGFHDKFDYTIQGESVTRNVGSLIEIKTKKAEDFDKIDWCAHYFQMLFAGVDKLVLGLHSYGDFEVPREFSLAQVKAQVDQKMLERLLCQLEMLLEMLLEYPCSLDLFCAGEEFASLIVAQRDTLLP